MFDNTYEILTALPEMTDEHRHLHRHHHACRHPGREAGAASGMLQTIQQMGGALGLSILVTAFGTATRAMPAHLLIGTPPAMRSELVFTHGLTSVFLLAAVFALLSLANGLLVLRSPSRPEPAAMQVMLSE